MTRLEKKHKRKRDKKKAPKQPSAIRRAEYKATRGSYTTEEILTLYEYQHGYCKYCEIKIDLKGKNRYSIDHHMPLSKNGTNTIENIQLLCTNCNLLKADMLPDEFLDLMEKYYEKIDNRGFTLKGRRDKIR